MITQELLDKLNESEYGKELRLAYAEIPEEKIKEIKEKYPVFFDLEGIRDAAKIGNLGVLKECIQEYEDANSFYFTLDNLELLKEVIQVGKIKAEYIIGNEEMLNQLFQEYQVSSIWVKDVDRLIDFSGLQVSNIEMTIKDGFLIIQDMDELKKLLDCELFMKRRGKYDYKIRYVGKEPILPEILEKFGGITIEATSSLVFDENFCQNFQKDSDCHIKITDDSEEYEPAELSAVNEKIKEIIAGIPEDATEFEKVSYVYKKLAETIVYDEDHKNPSRTNIDRSLKGSLLEGKAVCLGYARVLKKILNELGIESKIIHGNSVEEDEKEEEDHSTHSWNQIKIDGVWYNADLTWDADSVRNHDQLRYFLLDDETFFKSHKPCEMSISSEDYMREDGFDFEKYSHDTWYGEHRVKKNECEREYEREKIVTYFETNLPKNFITISKQRINSLLQSTKVSFTEMKKAIYDIIMNVKGKKDNIQENSQENKTDNQQEK
ncbi:MAG: hypothetical protein IJ629_02105 [Clostridia bacterium]|nr:hypothetical protein [Clostridia bacterium]